MSFQETGASYGMDSILKDVIGAINVLNSGSHMPLKGSIGPESLLGADLGLKSLDLIRLVGAIQQLYSHKFIPFQDMFVTKDGNALLDVSVSHIVLFLHEQLNS